MFSNITILAPICPLATCCYQCQPSLRPGWVRFCRHVTSNHVMLTCPLWWACGSHGDNIGLSEYHPSHIGLESGVWPSGSHRSQEKNEYSPTICVYLLEDDCRHWKNDSECPSHTGLQTGQWPPGNQLSLKENVYSPCCWEKVPWDYFSS